MATIQTDLMEFLEQQKEFDRTVQSTEKEISAMSEGLKAKYWLNIISMSMRMTPKSAH